MNSIKQSQRMIILFAITLLLAGCSSQSLFPATETATSVPLSPPKSGEWTASADFGTFVFVVNPQSTGIAQLKYDYQNYPCGTDNGIYGWNLSWDLSSIVDNQFAFTIQGDGAGGTLSYSYHTTITGKFDETGTKATGTWKQENKYPLENKNFDTSCSGTWMATAPK